MNMWGQNGTKTVASHMITEATWAHCEDDENLFESTIFSPHENWTNDTKKFFMEWCTVDIFRKINC